MAGQGGLGLAIDGRVTGPKRSRKARARRPVGQIIADARNASGRAVRSDIIATFAKQALRPCAGPVPLKLFRRILRYVRPYRRVLAGAMLGMLMVASTDVIMLRPPETVGDHAITVSNTALRRAELTRANREAIFWP